jgi:hypothetical protein
LVPAVNAIQPGIIQLRLLTAPISWEKTVVGGIIVLIR